MSRCLVPALAISLLALASCRDLTFHSVCETTPNDPRCSDDVGSDTNASDSLSDALDVGDSAEVSDTASEADAGCTGVCKPGDSEVVTGGTCTGAFEEFRRACTTTCTWGAAACVLQKGWHAIAPVPVGFKGRSNTSGIWTGEELLIWGGDMGSSGLAADGARYNPKTNSWKLMAAPPGGFVGRRDHAFVWADGAAIVWGGSTGTGPLKDGAKYDPSKDAWTLLPASTLVERSYPSATFASTTGEAIFWGGAGGATSDFADGAAFAPIGTGAWSSMSAGPLVARRLTPMVWTGTQAILWGGQIGESTYLSDGARYNPVTKVWTKLDDPPLGFVTRGFVSYAPVAGGLAVFGGVSFSGAKFTVRSEGVFYDDKGAASAVPPLTDPVLTTPARIGAAMWCDDGTKRCWIWSGLSEWDPLAPKFTLGTGGAVWSVGAAWAAMPSSAEPAPRGFPISVWTGSLAIVWGGGKPDGTNLDDGAVFVP